MRFTFFLMMICLLTSAAGASDTPRLRFPVECALGDTCWLMNLPDTQPETGVFKDFQCSGHSYDGHDGTDIAVQDEAAMKAGVSVVAAQAGTVTRLRDGEDDQFTSILEQETIRAAGKACGNGLIIEHDDNWSTQYCHLKKGGFKVKQGDQVKAGQAIATLGLSGITDHPHLHLTLRHKGIVIDPFTGAELDKGCGQDQNKILKSLWGERVPVDGFNLYDAGFAAVKPDFGEISQGRKPLPPAYKSQVFIFWFAYFSAREGDRVSLRVTTPKGRILFDHEIVQDKNRARQYHFTGRELTQGLPEKGDYKGEARVTRVNQKGETRTETITRTLSIK